MCLPNSRYILILLTLLAPRGETLPLNGIVDGDHLIYVDFKKRHDLEARIKVAEDAGRVDIAERLDRCRRVAGILNGPCEAFVGTTGHIGVS